MTSSRGDRNQRWLYLFFKVAIVVGVVAALVLLLDAVQSVVIPFLFAFFVAYQTSPVVDWAERRRVPRALTTVALMLVVFVGVVVFLALFLPRFIGEFSDLVAALPGYLEELVASLGPWVHEHFGVEINVDLATLHEQIQAHGAALLSPTGSLLGSVASGVMGVLLALVNLILVPVFIFFLTVDYPRIVASAKDLVPPHERPRVFRIMGRIDTALSSFVRGQIVVTLFLALFYSVGLLVLGVKFAVFIGVIAAVANLIPYVGIAVGLTLSVLMTLLEWSGAGPLVGVVALFVAGNLMESFVLTPKIVGDRVGLSPLLVVVALLVWGQLMGILGVLIAIPATAVLRILLAELITNYRGSRFYTGEDSGVSEDA